MRPYTIAHRGHSSHYPENTILSFQKAIEAGADWIELDVVSTLDGHVVISHDTHIDRRTNGTGKISAMTLELIKGLDAGVRSGSAFAGERIPTLDEALTFFDSQPVRLCIEIKGDNTDEFIDTARKTVAILQQRNALQRVVISSFNPECLKAIKTWEPLLSTSLDPDRQDGTYTPWQLCQQVLQCHANFLLHRHDTLTTDIVDEAHQHGFSLWTWTVNSDDAMRRVIEMGVDAIMTDKPDILRRVISDTIRPRSLVDSAS
jgi:glycerophosphoryl diester phosphodiesterase